MTELVHKGEHLRGLAVARVDEHERCVPIAECESPKLLDAQLTMRVVAHDPVARDEHSQFLRALVKAPDGLGPIHAERAAIELQRRPNRECDRNGGGVQVCTTNPVQGLSTLGNQVLTEPLLAELTLTDGIDQLRARGLGALARDSTQVAYR